MRTSAPSLDSAAIPQANQLDRVVELVRSAVSGDPLEMELRDRVYYVQAAKLLALLDEDGAPSVLGRILVDLEDDSSRRLLLAGAFQVSPVGKCWMQWAKVNRIKQVDPSTAEDFLLGVSDLAGSTAQRRALTLRRWWADLCSESVRHESVRPLAPANVEVVDLKGLEWDELATAVDRVQRDLPLTRVDLPTRMRGFAERESLHSIGDLLTFRKEELLEIPNLGRKSIDDTRLAITSALEKLDPTDPESITAFRLEQYGDLFALLRDRFSQLPPQQRLVLTHRMGAHGRAQTLEELGSLLGVTRERVRQLETAALASLTRDDVWLRALEARLREKLSHGALALEELGRDRWFAGVDDRACELRFVTDRLLDSRLHVVELGERKILSEVAGIEVLEAESRLRAKLRTASFPLAFSDYEDLVAASTDRLPDGIIRELSVHFASDLQQVDGPHGPELVAFGTTRGKQVLAYVHASSLPVAVRDIEERFGRGVLPHELIHVGRGLVWTPDRVDGFSVWRDRLTPMCIAIMQKEDPERQWAAYELLEAVRERAQVPAWLGHWHLSSMLRTAGTLQDLGRLRFRLKGDGASDGRMHVHEIAMAVLQSARHPLSRERLLLLVRERGAATELAMTGVLSRLPFVQVDKDNWGLIDRDVPGGSQAFAHAMQAIEDRLREKQRGLSSVESWTFIRSLSPTHDGWSSEMVRSLARIGSNLRGAANGAIGLSEWDDVRVPTHAELLRDLLDERGQVAVEDVLDRIELVHGVRPGAPVIANLALSVGARTRAGVIVDASQGAPSAEPQVGRASGFESIAGVPDASLPLLSELLAKEPGELAPTRERIAQHLRRFERAAQTNEFLDVREAEQLAAGCNALLDSISGATPAAECRMIHAVAEYFITPADAEADLEIGGLDDDVAVFNAVVRALNRVDLVLVL